MGLIIRKYEIMVHSSLFLATRVKVNICDRSIGCWLLQSNRPLASLISDMNFLLGKNASAPLLNAKISVMSS